MATAYYHKMFHPALLLSLPKVLQHKLPSWPTYKGCGVSRIRRNAAVCQIAQTENYFTKMACVCNTSGRQSYVSHGNARPRMSAGNGGAADEGRVVVVGDSSCRSMSADLHVAASAPSRKHAYNMPRDRHAEARGAPAEV